MIKKCECPSCHALVNKNKFCTQCGASLVNAVIREVENDEDSILLVDCCKKRIATVGGDGYSEIILYLDSKGNERIEIFREYANTEPYHKVYKLNNPISQEVYKLIDELHIDKWNDFPAMGLCGAMYIIKYKDLESGEYIHVTSDRMPPNGINDYYKLSDFLGSFISNEEKSNE